MSSRFRTALIVVGAWVLIALAWTPPTALVQGLAYGQHRAGMPVWVIFANVLCGFVPWMAVTPLIFRLGRRWPISEHRWAGPIAIHAALGLIIIPASILIGSLISVLIFPRTAYTAVTPASILTGVLITSFYSVPTYIAVVAIGQALDYFERYKLRERMLARAQLQALEAQIQPHFLFNTLNSISALIYRDARKADAAIAKLSELMRQTLKERPQEVPLREEIAFAQNYLELCAMLTPGTLRTSFAVAPEAWNALVPPLFLQPLFENAIRHGISRRKEGGAIDVAASVFPGTLVIAITNDPADTPQTESGSGIGMSNVHARLAVLYGRHQGLELEDEEDGRVTARVKLPYREAE
ncbi:MAG TPA: histidine kinase [Rhizomicrobium sp.]|jgi:LytS/YehU family sensor histidine kinase